MCYLGSGTPGSNALELAQRVHPYGHRIKKEFFDVIQSQPHGDVFDWLRIAFDTIAIRIQECDQYGQEIGRVYTVYIDWRYTTVFDLMKAIYAKWMIREEFFRIELFLFDECWAERMPEMYLKRCVPIESIPFKPESVVRVWIRDRRAQV